MKSLKGSQTEKNILTAFCGESQARNRYTYFASKAKKEGYDRSPASSAKPPTRRRNTPSGCSSSWRAGTWKSPPPFRPA